MNHDPGCFLPERMEWPCICDRLRVAYRRGYNDHAHANAMGREIFGFIQHGEGENP
jgi:hypothetical protein